MALGNDMLIKQVVKMIGLDPDLIMQKINETQQYIAAFVHDIIGRFESNNVRLKAVEEKLDSIIQHFEIKGVENATNVIDLPTLANETKEGTNG
jgi:hypothetical protein